MSINYESNYLLPSISDQLCAYQKDRVSQMIRDFIETNRQMNQFHFEYCPKCGQFHPCSWKLERPKLVNKCWNALPVISGLYVITGSWRIILISHSPNGMIWSLKRRKEILFCIQRPRSMFMNQLFSVCVINTFILSKIWSLTYMVGHEVEMDETYVTHCRKGRIIDGHPGKKRGTPATKRGLSDEKICILTAVQRLGKCMARSLNVAKPSSMDAETFCECITDESYVWTDGLTSYVKPLKEKNCSNKVLESYQEYDAVNHLNNVNSFHSQIQEQYRVYRGVSSKYINRYNALFMLQREYMGMDSQEILLLIMKRLRKRVCYFFIRQIRKEDLFKLAIA